MVELTLVATIILLGIHFLTVLSFSCLHLTTMPKDVYFDFMNFTWQEEFSKELGIPVHSQRFWWWSKRQNNTYRPTRPLTQQEESYTVSEYWHRLIVCFNFASQWLCLVSALLVIWCWNLSVIVSFFLFTGFCLIHDSRKNSRWFVTRDWSLVLQFRWLMLDFPARNILQATDVGFFCTKYTPGFSLVPCSSTSVCLYNYGNTTFLKCIKE